LKNQTLFYGAAASTFIAGVLHLAIVPMFFNKIPANVAIFFIISGLAQLFWVIPVIKRWSNIWYYVGIGGTAILIILWVIVVPHNEVSELEVAIELFQIVFIILCTIIIANGRTISKFEEKNV
jgi:bacteriorhodopsin